MSDAKRAAAHARWGDRYGQLLAEASAGRGPGECHLWPGTKTKGGYPVYSGRYVHRRVAEAKPGETTRHTCDTPPCVNRRHLINGTQRQNIEDAVTKKRMGRPRGTATVCSRGHELTEENIVLRPHKSGAVYRACRECARENAQAYRDRRH